MFICDAMYLQSKGIQTENDIRDTVIYARVSTRNQKDDLQNQIEFLKQFCNAKCKELGIELRIVDRLYLSSKLCHECGCMKNDLKLSDREYICECGYHADRDYNASLNLRDTTSYKIA